MAWLRRLLFLLLFPVAAFGQGMRYDNFVLKPLPAGGVTPVSGTLITVCTSAGTGTPCTPKVANIYSDEALTTPITGTGGAGTTNSDANGNFGFYAAPGSYIVTVTGSGITSYTIKVMLPAGLATTNPFKNINGELYVSSNNSQGWAGADVGAWINSAIQALPASPVGGIIHLANAATMTFSTTITIDRPVHLTGALGSLNGRGSQLQYIGSGVAISIPANGGGTGTILENFSLDNTGTGTVGIDADSGNSDMRFWDIDINPSVPFSVASIRIGNTTSGNPLVNMVLEGLRVENGTTGVKLLRGNHVVISRTALFANTVNDLQIGDATHAVFDFECRNCEIEPNTVTTSTNVLVNNVQHAVFTDGYAETSSTAANPWISIPNTATLADGIIIRGYRFKSNAATAQSIAIVNLASATLGIEDSYASNYAASSFWVTNTSSRHVWFMGIHSDSTNISPASVNTNVEFFSSAQGSTIFGARVSSLASVGAMTPTSAGNADLGSASLPWGNLWLGTAATNNFKFQPAATAGARIITVTDPISPTTVGLPLTIASGTSTLTANAALAAVTSQAAITTAGTGILTTDSIIWSYASAPTAGDSLCHVSPYPTAGNVNFVRTNPTAAAQNVSAIVINWKVVR